MLKITREELSTRLKSYRDQNKISQRELADVLEVTVTTICKWENMKSIPRSLSNIKLLKSEGIIPKEVKNEVENPL